MALWLRDSARAGVLQALRAEIEADDATSEFLRSSYIDRAENYLDAVLKRLNRDALLDEEDELEPVRHGLYVADSGRVWELDDDGWLLRGYADENISDNAEEPAAGAVANRVQWLDIGREAETLTPWLRNAEKAATVYRGTSKSAHYVHKPFVWRVYCYSCRRDVTSRPVVKYRTAENRAIHHNQQTHGIEYWSD